MVGIWATVSLKVCVAVPPEFVAEMVIVYSPPVPALGVPDNEAVPLPLSVKVSPAGRLPVSVSAGCGAPLVLTVKLKVEPTVAVADAALVIFGAPVTVRTNDWVVEPAEFFAVIVNGKTPALVAGPVMSAVPSPLLLKLTPGGSVPDLLRLVVKVADWLLASVVTVKSKVALTATVVDAALVKTGTLAPDVPAALTVRVKVWVAEPPALVALSVSVEVPAAAVPAMVAVPLPLSLKVTPEGRAPVSVTLAALVKVGTLLTVRTNAWLVFPDELVAKKLIE